MNAPLALFDLRITGPRSSNFKNFTWKAALSADVRSFIADEPNTPRDDDDDTEDEYEEDEQFGVECCAPLLSLTWVSCADGDTLLIGQ